MSSPTSPDNVSPEAGVVARLRAAGSVFAEDEASVLVTEAGGDAGELGRMVALRESGLPLEQVVGWAAFAGLRVVVAPGVFVPRRRTELLVHEAAALWRDPASEEHVTLVDLCCGSGAVAAALAAELGKAGVGVAVFAVDVDERAVACARENLASTGADVLLGDLYDALPATLLGAVDLLVANAPYVPSGSVALMPPEARLHEPLVTLDGGPDGLDVQRRVVEGARRWLSPTGHLLVETSARQAAATLASFERHGLTSRVVRSAVLDATVVIGSPSPRHHAS